jgi:hypothetical protein
VKKNKKVFGGLFNNGQLVVGFVEEVISFYRENVLVSIV